MDDVGAQMARLARTLQREHSDVPKTLLAITAAVVTEVPGAEAAGITLVSGRTLETRASTGSVPEAMDALQVEVDEGPCLQALWEQRTILVTDMAAETRWPRFAARAAERGCAACCRCTCSPSAVTSAP